MGVCNKECDYDYSFMIYGLLLFIYDLWNFSAGSVGVRTANIMSVEIILPCVCVSSVLCLLFFFFFFSRDF